MTKDALWAKYCERNPVFSNPDAKLSMSGRGLRKLFEQTYDIAHAQGVRNGKALSDMSKPKDAKGSFESMFGSLFK